tara:strand:- start:6089 stop:7024 length:936 start_codon:yes stop_codon:yes gene_type:complete
MKHTFTAAQIKKIIIEELENSRDEDEAEDLLRKIIGLNEDETDEFEAKMKKAKKFKKAAGISLLGAVAILFGGLAAVDGSQETQVKQDVEKAQQLDDETLARFGVDTAALDDPDAAAEKRGRAYATAELGLVDMTDLGNDEKIEAAWDQIDNMVDKGELSYDKAKVSSRLPMVSLDYDALPPNLMLPNSLGTKDQYRAWLVQNILKGDVKKVADLQKFVFGNTGKWPSGSGKQKSRMHKGSQVLPPEWSVAYDLLGDVTEEFVSDLASGYKNASPEDKEMILQANGAESPEQLEKFLNQALMKAGRQPVNL